MNPFRWSYRASFFVGFLICAALLGFAFYAELVLGMVPCPLCIFQRIAFLFMALFFLVGALHGPHAGGRWGYTALVLVGGIFGIAVAWRHLWIQSLAPDQIPSCGPNLGYLFSTFPFAQVLKMVFTGSGECAKVEPILGMPMPFWSLIWFVLLSVWAIRATLQRRRSGIRL